VRAMKFLRFLRRRRTQETRPCPNCSADVPVRSLACRSCGSDAETGWAEEPRAKGLDLPSGYGGEDEFDYDEYLKRELGRTTDGRRVVLWRRVGVAVIVGILTVLMLLLA
jgi:hypothetical protein